MRTGGGGGAVLRRWRGAVGGVMVVGLVVAAGCAQEREGGLGVDDLPEVPGAPAEAEALLLDAVDRTMAVESVEPGGIESVGGADVRMVSGTIDRDAAFAAATVDEQLLMDDASSSSSSAGERFEFELGIDRDRRIRSLEYTITPSDDEGLGIQVRLRLEVRRFDHPVEPPEPPPTGETISIYAIPGGPGALTDDD